MKSKNTNIKYGINIEKHRGHRANICHTMDFALFFSVIYLLL